ncbi:MAG: hypothetical protein COB04_16895 [Gammaproteobacteria bacterium]|nr:MAG: hypothetical protein COB04_16895 [Gammaproteobacteria bacterium]
MVLDRFFKPKWQHKKAQTRLQAVAQLDPKDKEQLNILRTLATGDTEPTVQQSAVQRINQIQPLEEMLKNHPDQQLEHWLTHQIAQLLAHKQPKELNEAEQIQYIQKCDHQEVIQYLALNAEISALQLAAIQKLDSESHLSQVAISASSSTLRFAAAERIHSKQALAEVANLIKNKDKKVTRLVKDKLSHIEQTDHHTKQQLLALEESIESIEKLAKATHSIQFEGRLKGIALKWKQFPESSTLNYLPRYQSALDRCQSIIDEHQQEQAAQQHHKASLESAAQEQINACEELEGCLDGLGIQVQKNELDEPALNAVISSQHTRWEVACQSTTPESSVLQRYQQSSALINQVLAANQRLKEKESTIEPLLKKDAKDFSKLRNAQRTVSATIKYIAWPNGFQSHPTLEQLSKLSVRLQDQEKDKQQLIEQRINTLNQTIKKIEDSINQGQVKAARKLAKDVRKELADLPHGKTKSLTRAFHTLQSKMDEYSDWQGFATTPKKDQLIEKMEQLIESEIDVEDRADQIHALQVQWKQLGASDPKRSKSQWDRFKTAADQAYEPCKAYFQDKSAQRGDNLAKRVALCEQLENYIESMNWESADWKKVEEIHQVARKEWQQYSPVDRAAGKDAQQRFNQALKAIQERINSEKDNNAEQKNQLITQAKALLEEQDLYQAIEGIKSLQSDWKKIGVTQHQQGRQQWKEFREHCDAIFARRDKQRSDKVADQESQTLQADQICQAFEQLIQQDDYNQIINTPRAPNQFQTQLDALTNIPNNKRKSIEQRLAQLNQDFAQALLSATQQQLLGQLSTAREGADICRQIEQLSGTDSTQLETLTAKWPEQFCDLDKSWQKAINARLKQATDKVNHADTTSNTTSNNALLEDIENLCIGMEILSNIESPSSAQSKRMAYQVNRLASGLGQSNQAQTDQEQMIDMELKWLQQPWVDAPEYAGLVQRYERAIQAFYSKDI